MDNTAVHPESYAVAKKFLKLLPAEDDAARKERIKNLSSAEIHSYAEQLGIGVPTFTDICKELVSPTRDPRKEIRTAKLQDDITDISHLKVGQILEGTIRNVVPFGFFVDLGVEISGLVHISEISSTHRVNDPHTEGKPGDIVKVKVIAVDVKKQRISLSMKGIKQNGGN